MSTQYDVAIIGAGPAGTACALALRDSGLQVVLIDRTQFPRDKVCGDAIPGPALKAVRQLLGSRYHELHDLTPQAKVTESRLFAPDGSEVRVRWKLQTFNSPRLHFDHQLMEMVKKYTSVRVLENYAVCDIRVDDTQATLLPVGERSPITCRVVIGCDGANAVSARKLALQPLDRRYHCAAVRAYFTDVADVAENTTEFYFLKPYLPGYFWVFPVGNGTCNVGFGMLSEAVADRQLNLRETLCQIIQQHPRIAPRFRQARQHSAISGFGLPLGGASRPIAGPRFMLAGDAASLVDPLQGHGIDTAIRSGILAARQAQRCFQTNDFSSQFMQWYTRQIDRQLGKQLTRSYRYMRLLSRQPWLVNAGFRLARNPVIKAWLLNAFG